MEPLYSQIPTLRVFSTIADPSNVGNRLVMGGVITGVPPTTYADVFGVSCVLQRDDSSKIYKNAGTVAVPSWAEFDTGTGGGIAIGDSVADADAGSILYVDGSGNLTQDDVLFTRTETETFIENVIDLGMGEILRSGFTSPAGISRIGGSYVVSGTPQLFTEVVADPSEGEVRSFVNYVLAGITSGFKTKARVSTIGDIAGGNGTYITVDDFNEKITVANVPTYADDAAAITGGLTTGMLYKTTTGGITALNIVP